MRRISLLLSLVMGLVALAIPMSDARAQCAICKFDPGASCYWGPVAGGYRDCVTMGQSCMFTQECDVTVAPSPTGTVLAAVRTSDTHAGATVLRPTVSEASVALQAIADSLSTVLVTETQRNCKGFVTAFYLDAGVRRSLKVELQIIRV